MYDPINLNVYKYDLDMRTRRRRERLKIRREELARIENSVTRILGFWHICMINHYLEVISEQLQLIIDSKLYDSTESILVGCVGDENELSKVKELFFNYPKIVIAVHKPDVQEYEFPTLNILKQKSDIEGMFNCFYIHTKGVSYIKNEGSVQWRNHMNHYVLTKWEDDVKKLREGNDTCGVRLIPQGHHSKHYSGNFWWAKSNYIKKLCPIKKLNKKDRFAAEMWVCSKRSISANLE